MSGVGEALGAAVDALRAAGVEEPRLDAELLLSEATGLERTQLIARPEIPLEGGAARSFAEMVRRRLRREPVAYIIGRRWFRHLELRCDRRALIPRPETELLVEVALELGDRVAERATSRSGGMRPHILDIGTGTGAVALAIAAERPGWRLVATDTSAEALSLARENAALHGLADRVELIEGTLPSAEKARMPGAHPDRSVTDLEALGFDLVVANLPYIPDRDWPDLAPEIHRFEPRSALVAGPEGLDVIRAVVAAVADRYTDPRPAIALEIGVGQAAAVAAILREAGWDRPERRRDLAGIERVVFSGPSDGPA